MLWKTTWIRSIVCWGALAATTVMFSTAFAGESGFDPQTKRVVPLEDWFDRGPGVEFTHRFTPPPTTTSGDYRFTLARAQRINLAQAGWEDLAQRYGTYGLRLVVKVEPVEGDLPSDLEGGPGEMAIDDRSTHLGFIIKEWQVSGRAIVWVNGQAQPMEPSPAREKWFGWTFDLPSPEATALRLFTGAIGLTPPWEQQTCGPYELASLRGKPLALPELRTALEVAEWEWEETRLARPSGVRYGYSSSGVLEENAPNLQEPIPPGHKYWSLRFYTLESAPGWQLSNLTVTGADGRCIGGSVTPGPADSKSQPLTGWAFLNRSWRPDWGGWLGAETESLTPERQAQTGAKQGAYVMALAPGGPAAKAGLQPGDVIVAVGGKPVERPYVLNSEVRVHAPGSTVAVDLYREGQRQTVNVLLGEGELWPGIDTPRLQAAWQRLLAVLRPGTEAQVRLSQREWQSQEPIPEDFQPATIAFEFVRPTGDFRNTTFAFYDVPLPRELLEPATTGERSLP